jgi:hypothetical protein
MPEKASLLEPKPCDYFPPNLKAFLLHACLKSSQGYHPAPLRIQTKGSHREEVLWRKDITQYEAQEREDERKSEGNALIRLSPSVAT